MAETKEITRLHVVVDSETYYENIGDIDGGMFDSEWLEGYIRRHGSEKLIKKLAYMQRQVVDMEVRILNNMDSVVNDTAKDSLSSL